MPRKPPANGVKKSAVVKSVAEANLNKNAEKKTGSEDFVEGNAGKKVASVKQSRNKNNVIDNAQEKAEAPEKNMNKRETAGRGRKKVEKALSNDKQEHIIEQTAAHVDTEDAESEKQEAIGKGKKRTVKNNAKKIENKELKVTEKSGEDQTPEDHNNMNESETESLSDEKEVLGSGTDKELSQKGKSGAKRGKRKLESSEEEKSTNTRGKGKKPSKEIETQEIEENSEENNDSEKPTLGPKSSKKRKNSKSEKDVEDNDEAGKQIVKKNKRQEKLPVEELASEVSEKPVGKQAKGKTTGIPRKVGNKSTKGTKVKENSDDDFEQAPKSKGAKRKEIPDVAALDFNNTSTSPAGKTWNLKLSSWNINGIRAWLEKNGFSYLVHEKPDIMCVQETKCSDDKLPAEVKNVEGYHTYWLSGDKDGYSGIGLLSKVKPVDVQYGIGIKEHDNEGRVITAEYKDFYLVTTYVPNSGRGLVRLDYRQKWDKDFRAYLNKLDKKKPVILCGDLNVAHEEIDIARPKSNKKNAGFTIEEREGFSALLKEGFVDTFRHLYPDAKDAYTFWTYMMNARAKNIGWRLDYFVISKRFTDYLCDSVIRKDVSGSDHCPVALFLSI